MRISSATDRADAVRAYTVGLRLDPKCLEAWYPYLDDLDAKGWLPRRAFFQYALWVCAREHQDYESATRADQGWQHHMEGLHHLLRTTGFLSEFGRARRSWDRVDKIMVKRQRRERQRRRFHGGRSSWADFRVGLTQGEEAMSRGPYSRPEVNESLRDYVRQLIADWRKGLCGPPESYPLPDRKDRKLQSLRSWERDHALTPSERFQAKRRRREAHG